MFFQAFSPHAADPLFDPVDDLRVVEDLGLGALHQAAIARQLQDAFDGMNLRDLPEGQVRVLRLLVYEGDKADVARVRGRSFADGCRDEKTYRIHALTIRSSRVKSTADRAAAAGAVGALRTVLGWLRERGPQEDLDLRIEALLAEIDAAWKG